MRKRPCKFHQEYSCKWCTKWRKTFSFFRKRNCSKLTLYCVRLTHYHTKESFYKVGLTSNTVEKRFEEDLERFKLQIIEQEVMPLYKAVTSETELLFTFQKQGRLYRPKARISGYTECFR